MLTKREREWLADREEWNFKLDINSIPCFCPSCNYCKYVTETANGVFCQDAEDMWLYDKLSMCPLIPSKVLLLDATEFEARVAAKLADSYYPPMDVGSDGPHLFMPPADRLKWARLAVEEETDADIQAKD